MIRVSFVSHSSFGYAGCPAFDVVSHYQHCFQQLRSLIREDLCHLGRQHFKLLSLLHQQVHYHIELVLQLLHECLRCALAELISKFYKNSPVLLYYLSKGHPRIENRSIQSTGTLFSGRVPRLVKEYLGEWRST